MCLINVRILVCQYVRCDCSLLPVLHPLCHTLDAALSLKTNNVLNFRKENNLHGVIRRSLEPVRFLYLVKINILIILSKNMFNNIGKNHAIPSYGFGCSILVYFSRKPMFPSLFLWHPERKVDPNGPYISMSRTKNKMSVCQ